MKKIKLLYFFVSILCLTFTQSVNSQCVASNETTFLSCLNGGSSQIQITKTYTVNGDLDLSDITFIINNGKELTLPGNININDLTTFSGGGAARVTNNGMTSCNSGCGDITFSELNSRISSGQYATLFDALTGTQSALPIELNYFSTSVSNGITYFEWATYSETNNDYFEIEWSENGRDFKSIYMVNGAGTTEKAQFYDWKFSDVKSGSHYYRLKQTDFDGQISYSKTNFITIPDLENFSMLSNIIENDLRFLVNEIPEDEIIVFVSDYSGKLLIRNNFILDGDKFNLNVSSLNKGAYLVTIQYRNEIITKRFFKV